MHAAMTHPRDELLGLVRSMRLLVASEREAGAADVAGAPAPVAASPPDPRPAAAAAAARPATARAPAAPNHATLVPRLDLPDDVLAPFGDLPARVAACTRCRLCESRTFTVFGEGTPTARLVFCGEGPGFDEDRSGRPFVGRAGELLSDMIVKGMRMRREDVFILNAVKCRPPENRTPAPDEIAACRPFLAEQLELIRPAVIVALGNPASQALLGTVPGITRIRGRVFEAFGAKVVPTYHPAFLLRNPAGKRETWTDLQLVMRLLAPAG
jgi:DNA polymerase